MPVADQSASERWACPRCGSTGYVVGGVLRCGNAGCLDTAEYDPDTGDRLYHAARDEEQQRG